MAPDVIGVLVRKFMLPPGTQSSSCCDGLVGTNLDHASKMGSTPKHAGSALQLKFTPATKPEITARL
jgi:hypothetical protein